MEAQRLDLPIGGMHCAGCVARVEESPAGPAWVQEAQVNLATETATLHYEPAALRLEQVVQAVQASGYQVRLEHTTIPVKGMHCAGCVATIERALRSVSGVVEAQVNLATEQPRWRMCRPALRQAPCDKPSHALATSPWSCQQTQTWPPSKALKSDEMRALQRRFW